MFRNLIASAVVSGLALTAAGQATEPADRAAPADPPAPTTTSSGTTVVVAPDDHAAATAAQPQAQEQRPWPKLVESFAKSLAAGDAAGVDAALSSRASVRRFEGAKVDDAQQLAGRLAKSSVVGQHAYVYPPLVMAADIAADVKNAVGIPDRAKARFLVDDDVEIKGANKTASNWVADVLEVAKGTPVGVIELWTPRPPMPGAAADAAGGYDVTFVLCRGEEVAAGEFKITAVVYGVPVADQQ